MFTNKMATTTLFSANNGSHAASTPSTWHEAQDDIWQKRASGRQHFFKFGVIQLILGFGALLIGVLSLVYGVPTGSFPFFLGVPLWCGGLVVLAGVFGVVAGRQVDESNGGASNTEKCMVVCNYVMTFLSLMLSVTMPVFGGLGVYYCLNPGSTDSTTVIYCEPNRYVNIALSSISLAIGIIIIVISFPVLIFFCYYARAYGVNSRQQQRQEMMQMQQKINQLEQQVKAQNDRNSLNDTTGFRY